MLLGGHEEMNAATSRLIQSMRAQKMSYKPKSQESHRFRAAAFSIMAINRMKLFCRSWTKVKELRKKILAEKANRWGEAGHSIVAPIETFV